ncbi:MAG: hypothetical protein AB7H80_04290 [Candidatus Kapaibacterium sp.]
MCKKYYAVIVPFLLLLISMPAFSETNQMQQGNCPDGTLRITWWTVHEYDDYGNLLCSSGRNCDGDSWTNCGTVNDPGLPPNLQSAITAYEFIPGTGSTKWVVKEKDASGAVRVINTMSVTGYLDIVIVSGYSIQSNPDGGSPVTPNPSGLLDMFKSSPDLSFTFNR